MSDVSEQPFDDQPLRNLAFLRAAIWLIVTLVVLLLTFRGTVTAPWALRAAAFGLVYSAVTSAIPYSRGSRPARLIDLAVDSICGLAVALDTGGSSSPFSPLLFLAVLEAQDLTGMGGAAGVATAATTGLLLASQGTREGITRAGLLGGAMLLETMLLHRLGIRPFRRGTVLPERTVEDMEMLVEAVEEQNRRLRHSHKELTSAVKRAQSGTEDAAARYQLLSASLDEEEVDAAYHAVLEVVRDQFEAEAAVIWALDYREERLEVRAMGGPVSPIVQAESIPLPPGAQASSVRKQCEQRLRFAIPESSAEEIRPVEVDGVVDPAETRPDVIAAALRAGEKIVGAIAIGCAKEGRFAVGDAARLGGLSAAAALAVRSVEQRTTLQRGLREISILHEMNLLAQNTSDLDRIYDQIVKLVSKAVPFENCTIFRYQPEQNTLLPVNTRGRQINLMEHIPFEHGSGVSAYVAGHRKQLFIGDLTREPGILNAELMPPRVRSFVSVPLVVRDHLIGVINVSHSRANAFSQEQARVLNLLAGQAAMTIEREEMVRSLEQLAITDGLTGIYNHRYFQMRLENEVKRARRYKLPFSLLMVDLDHFKNINDRYGHATGDLVLAEVAGIIRKSVRETDICARYGGEEFTVLLTQTSGEDALRTAERLRAMIAGHQFETTECVPLRLTVSVGIANCPENGESHEELLEASDRALYAAKKGGRNRSESA